MNDNAEIKPDQIDPMSNAVNNGFSEFSSDMMTGMTSFGDETGDGWGGPEAIKFAGQFSDAFEEERKLWNDRLENMINAVNTMIQNYENSPTAGGSYSRLTNVTVSFNQEAFKKSIKMRNKDNAEGFIKGFSAQTVYDKFHTKFQNAVDNLRRIPNKIEGLQPFGEGTTTSLVSNIHSLIDQLNSSYNELHEAIETATGHKDDHNHRLATSDISNTEAISGN